MLPSGVALTRRAILKDDAETEQILRLWMETN